MRYQVKHSSLHRIISAVLAVAMVLTMLPVTVLASASAAISTNITSVDFAPGEQKEFTVTITANDDAGKNAYIESAGFAPATGLEYFEIKDGENWVTIDDWKANHPDGTVLADGDNVYTFRAQFSDVTTATFSISVIDKDTSAEIVSLDSEIAVTRKECSITIHEETTDLFIFGTNNLADQRIKVTITGNDDSNVFLKGTAKVYDKNGNPISTHDVDKNAETAGEICSLSYNASTSFYLHDRNHYVFKSNFTIGESLEEKFFFNAYQVGDYKLVITLTAVEDDRVVATLTKDIKVRKQSAMSFAEKNVELTYGGTEYVNTLTNDVGGTVSYTSDNEDVVKVDNSGKLTYVGLGEATITATREETDEYFGESVSYKVKVGKGNPGVLNWSIPNTSIPEKNPWNVPFTNNVWSATIDVSKVTYSSSNEEIATVDAYGEVTFKKPGTVEITAYYDGEPLYEDVSNNYTITAVKAGYREQIKLKTPDGAEINSDVTITSGNTLQLVISNKDALHLTGNTKIEYSSSDPGVVSVDENGIITANKAGNATITITVSADELYENNVTKTVNITVNRKNNNDFTFENSTNPIIITYEPDFEFTNEAINGNLGVDTEYWIPADQHSIATVEPNTGIVKIHKAGTVTVYAKSPQNAFQSEREISYTLVINPAENKITVNGVTGEAGSEQLTLTYNPDGEQLTASALGDDVELSYEIEDAAIATVDENGIITFKNNGTTKLTITAGKTDQYKAATLTITLVVNRAERGDMTIAPTLKNGETITKNGGWYGLTYSTEDGKMYFKLNPSCTGDGNPSFAVVNRNNAEVSCAENKKDEFEIKAAGGVDVNGEFKKGYVEITVTYPETDFYNKKSETFMFYIDKADQTLEFKQPEYNFLVGQTISDEEMPSLSKTGVGSGTITYELVFENEDGVKATIDESGKLVLTNYENGTFKIKAVKSEEVSSNYNTAETECTVNVEYADIGDKYTVNGEEQIKDWYNTDVQITADKDYRLFYMNSEGEKVDVADTLKITKDGIHNLTFFVQDVNDNSTSAPVVITVKKDTVNPLASIKEQDAGNLWEKFLTFFNESENTVLRVVAEDVVANDISDISGIDKDKIEYYIAEGETARRDVTDLEAITEWNSYNDNSGIQIPSDKKSVVYAKVWDKAGNYIYVSTNGVVYDATVPTFGTITFTGNSADIDGKTYYNEDVTVKLTTTDELSGISKIVYTIEAKGCDKEEETYFDFNELNEEGKNPNENPEYSQLITEKEVTFTVLAEKFNTPNVKVTVTVIDNAGNSNSTSGTINIAKYIASDEEAGIQGNFTLDVKFEKESDFVNRNGIDYYSAKRKATITIVAVDDLFKDAIKDDIISVGEEKGNSDKGKTYVISGWESTEENVHTATVEFNGNAVYTFKVDYVDKFDTKLSHEARPFAVDTDKPTATVSINNNKWAELAEKLTFGLWTNDTAKITAESKDATSMVEQVHYYKVAYNEDNKDLHPSFERHLTEYELKALAQSEWKEFGTGVEFDTDEAFVIYLRLIDTVGNTSYICSDGYIVDKKADDMEIIITPEELPEGKLSYGSNFNVNVKVADNTTYSSGIKYVDYLIKADGVDIVSDRLFNYEKETYDSQNYPVNAPTLDTLVRSFKEDVPVDAVKCSGENVSFIVKVTDNAGNNYVQKIALASINTVDPEIDVEFDKNECNEKQDGEIIRGYFNSTRTAIIRYGLREDMFDMERVIKGINIVKNGTVLSDAEKRAMTTLSDLVLDSEDGKKVFTVSVYFKDDANYEFTLSYTDKSGHVCEYRDVKSAEEAEKEGIEYTHFAGGTKAERYFTVDTKTPENIKVEALSDSWSTLIEVLTFGLFTTEDVRLTASATDETSPFDMYYYKTDKTDAAMTAEELDAITDGWVLLKDGTETFTADNDTMTVYVKYIDYARNRIYASTNGIIVDNTDTDVKVELPETKIYHEDGVPVYNGDVRVLITAREERSGLKEVKYTVTNSGTTTQEKVLLSGTSGVAYNELNMDFSKEIIILSQANNGCDITLTVTVTDNAGNTVTTVEKLCIDITKPVINVTFDNNEAYKVTDGIGYFPAGRKATVVITERTKHFDAKKATESIVITAKNAKGETVIKDCSALIGKWDSEGTGNEATHTAVIDFTADAAYSFKLSYTDYAGNVNEPVNTGDTVAPYDFVVDKTKPFGTVTANEKTTWEKLIEFLTFKFWSKDSVTITGTNGDDTAGIETVSYYKTAKTELLGRDDLNAIANEEWTAFTTLTIPADERFVLYIRIIDNAGNCEYISTNGIIVDDTVPDVELLKPEITITPQPAHDIYNTDVTVAVKVVEPKLNETESYAGLKIIRYEIHSLGEKTQEGILYEFKVQDPEHSDLKQSWEKKNAIIVDKNKNNSNDVEVILYAEDNAGNSSQAVCDLKIDITAPTISVQYDNNSGDTSFADGVFFKNNRTATITVTERNFDPEKIKLVVTNTDGFIPVLSQWTTKTGTGNGDNTTHTAQVVFDRDGDYTFSISGSDLALNNNDGVDYGASLAPEKFTVDKTLPVISITYDNNAMLNDIYYKAGRTATITITEHNFETGRINLQLAATDNGNVISLPAVSSWSTSGDVHTATISYSADARYEFDIDYNDKAGNALSDVAQQIFYVDTTNPTLKFEGVNDKSANNDKTIGFTITATDTNFNGFDPVLTAVIRNGDKFETKQITLDDFTEIANGMVCKSGDIEADGIYRVTCVLVDKAGNEYTEVAYETTDGRAYTAKLTSKDVLATFTVNRNGSVYELKESTTELIANKYVQSVPFDVEITEINADPISDIKITLNDKVLTEGEQYNVVTSGEENGWKKYTYIINKNLFENEGEYTIVVSSKDKADNNAFSDIKDASVRFIVDKTAPTVAVSGIDMNGRYQAESQEVTIIPKDDGGALSELYVYLVDSNGNTIGEPLISYDNAEDLAKKLAENNGELKFTLNEGLYQNVRIECKDSSSSISGVNVYDHTITNVSVTANAFMIFWANEPLRWGVIGGIGAVIVGLIIFLVVKRRKKED
ncbi:MAG: Ig-like domain-containing protein [Ruminiclostridium sp.]|nr:Ig-like domain-containing protein [Ruminiclostridium sp.]